MGSGVKARIESLYESKGAINRQVKARIKSLYQLSLSEQSRLSRQRRGPKLSH